MLIYNSFSRAYKREDMIPAQNALDHLSIASRSPFSCSYFIHLGNPLLEFLILAFLIGVSFILSDHISACESDPPIGLLSEQDVPRISTADSILRIDTD